MGMSPAEFWDMPPYLFELKRKGFQQIQNKAAIYFREMYALTFNANRSEKASAIDGIDVVQLPGEKKKTEPKQRAPKLVLTLDEIARIQALYNK